MSRPKPNGKPLGVFAISIDDGYVEYKYDVHVGTNRSITQVYRKIRKAFKAKESPTVIRTHHWPPPK